LHQLPAAQTLEALRRSGASLYSTRQDGAVTVRTDGRRIEVKTFREGGFRTMPERCGS
jgi:beta-lactamase superfamily II metal-dependent hydrolase